MGLKPCKECRMQISSKAKSCPNCGVPIKSGGIGCGGVILLLIFLGVIGNAIGPDSNSEYNSSNTYSNNLSRIKIKRIIKDYCEEKYSTSRCKGYVEDTFNEESYQTCERENVSNENCAKVIIMYQNEVNKGH